MNPRQQELLFDLESDIEEVRKSALIWLAQIGDLDAVPSLRKVAGGDEVALRHFAKRAIDEIEIRNSHLAGDTVRLEPAQVDDLLPGLESDLPSVQIESAQKLLPTKDSRAVDTARRLLPSATQPELVVALVHLIAAVAESTDVPLLLVRLSDPDPTIRGETVEALDQYYDERIRDHLISMTGDADNRVRGTVLMVLGRYDESLIEGALTEMAFSKEVWMKDSAVFVCKRLASEWTVEILGRLYRDLRSDTYLGPKVEKALQDLETSGNPHAIRIRKSLHEGRFEQEANRRDLLRVLESLEQEIRDQEEGRDKRVERVQVETLAEFRRAVEHKSFERRLSAVAAAHQFDTDEVLPVLRSMIGPETHPWVVSKLTKELGRLGDRSDIERIVPFLQHPDDRVRANTVEGLGYIGGEFVYDHVKELEDDPSPRVRANVLRITYRVNRERSLARLREMIVSKDAADSTSAIYTLSEVYSDDILDLIELALDHQEQEVKIRILKVLQLLSKKSGLASELYSRYREEGDRLLIRSQDIALPLKMSRDPAPDVRIKAFEALSRSPDPEARRTIERGLKDPEPRVREQASRSLAIYDLNQERLTQIYRLGSLLYRAVKAPLSEGSEDRRSVTERKIAGELGDYVDEIEAASRELDRGGSFSEILDRRTTSVHALAREAVARIENGDLDELTGIAEIKEIVTDLRDIDRRIEFRLEELEHEEVQKEAARASGKFMPDGGPDSATGAFILTLSWLVESFRVNRNAAVVGAGVFMVGILSLLAWSLTGASFLSGWTWNHPGGMIHVTHSGDRVIAVNDSGRAFSLSGRDGGVLWQANARRIASPFPPLLDLGRVLIAGSGGHLLSLSKGSGKELWEIKSPPLVRVPFKVGGQYWLFSGGPNPSVQWIEPRTGKVEGSLNLKGQEILQILPLEDHVVKVLPKSVQRVDSSLATTIWTTELEGAVVPTPLPFCMEDRIVVRTASWLTAIDAAGTKVWKIAVEESSRIVNAREGGAHVLVVDAQEVRWIDGTTGDAQDLTLDEPPIEFFIQDDGFYYSTAAGVMEFNVETGRQQRVEGLDGTIRDLVRVEGVLLAATPIGIVAVARPE